MYRFDDSKVRKLIATVGILRQRSREGHLPLWRQLLETTYLWPKNGLDPSYYAAAGLYRRSLTWRDKREHISGSRHLRLLREANDVRFQFVPSNKVVAYGLMRAFSVPSPPFFGVVNGNGGQTVDGRPLTSPAHLEDLCARFELRRLCFKLVAGWAGHGFHRVTVGRNGRGTVRIEPDGPELTLVEFWEGLRTDDGMGYICQGVVDQHTALEKLNPSSVNTARIWMVQPCIGEWEMFAGLLRIGVGRIPVDNARLGAIMSRIDLHSGRLSAAVDETPNRVLYDQHPVSGEQIAGTILPMWEQILPLCIRACNMTPYFKVVGLDVAFSKTGPIVLEIESEPSEDQMGFDRGVASLLKALAGQKW